MNCVYILHSVKALSALKLLNGFAQCIQLCTVGILCRMYLSNNNNCDLYLRFAVCRAQAEEEKNSDLNILSFSNQKTVCPCKLEYVRKFNGRWRKAVYPLIPDLLVNIGLCVCL